MTVQITIRVSEEERELLHEAAKQKQKSLNTWGKEILLYYAKEIVDAEPN